MSLISLILLALFGTSLLCALLIISAAVVSGRSTQRLAAKQSNELHEEAEIPYSSTSSHALLSATKTQEQQSNRLLIRER